MRRELRVLPFETLVMRPESFVVGHWELDILEKQENPRRDVKLDTFELLTKSSQWLGGFAHSFTWLALTSDFQRLSSGTRRLHRSLRADAIVSREVTFLFVERNYEVTCKKRDRSEDLSRVLPPVFFSAICFLRVQPLCTCVIQHQNWLNFNNVMVSLQFHQSEDSNELIFHACRKKLMKQSSLFFVHTQKLQWGPAAEQRRCRTLLDREDTPRGPTSDPQVTLSSGPLSLPHISKTFFNKAVGHSHLLSENVQSQQVTSWVFRWFEPWSIHCIMYGDGENHL